VSRGSIALIVCCASVGCAAALPRATPGDVELARARWPETTVQELNRGREVYANKCSGCHQLYLPSSRPPTAWPPVLAKMASEAKLTEQQSELIERYLVTLSERARGISAR
jgi:mono/diheme cytochrome c family protein